MIYVTGDTHGEFTRFNSENFPEQKEMTKDDFVIICGDFGIWDGSKKEEYWMDWLNNKNFTTLFVDGNHSNFDILNAMSKEKWNGGDVHFIRPSVIHLCRGQVFTLQEKTFFTFGGASSHDISAGILEPDDPEFDKKRRALHKDPFALYRINHVSWWKEELPNEEEMQTGMISLAKYNNQVDYIITHSPYTSLLKQMDGGSGLYQKDTLTDYLQMIKQTTDYKHWLFGHMHMNQTFYYERASCLYEQIIRIL